MVHRGEVEHDQWAVEAEAGRRLPVEHAAEVAVHETAQLERHVAALLHERGTARPQRERRVGAGVEQRVDHLRKGGRRLLREPRACGRLGEGRVDRRTLPREQLASETRHREGGGETDAAACRVLEGVSRGGSGVRADVGSADGSFGVERVEPDVPAGAQCDRPHAPGPGRARRTPLSGRPPRHGGRRPPAARDRTSRTSSCPARSGRRRPCSDW